MDTEFQNLFPAAALATLDVVDKAWLATNQSSSMDTEPRSDDDDRRRVYLSRTPHIEHRYGSKFHFES